MDKRYQVFVSSTYEDLKEPRAEVMQALLELDCMPAGMELFPAANDDQWSLIKRVIDSCDYYIVISAGRYGSIGSEGFSYTEMEYRYAAEQNKPIIGFLHKEPNKLPADCCDSDPEKKASLAKFRELISTRMVKRWSTPAELGGVVSRSLINLIKTTPAIGWIRADQAASDELAKNIIDLTRENEKLKKNIQSFSVSGPVGVEGLAQGTDQTTMTYRLMENRYAWNGGEKTDWMDLETNWNEVISTVLPAFMSDTKEAGFHDMAARHIFNYADNEVEQFKSDYDLESSYVEIFPDTMTQILVQFRALGLIEKSSKARTLKDRDVYWTLTPYGESVMLRLRAEKRPK